MGDVFKEQIVKQKPSSKNFFIKVGVVVLVVLLFFVTTVFIQPLAVILTAAAAFGAYYLFSFMNLEYEYVFTNGELDIDVIYNKTRRKRMFSGYVKDMEIMAHVDDKMHIGDFSSAQETKNYNSGEVKDNTYAFLYTYKGKKQKIVIEPNEKMMQAIASVLSPRKLFVKK